jgi:phage shock protein PspC (stress-responsive transcriptional regulator)
MISGVSAGLGHYFELMPYGLEYFILLVLRADLAYIILWIVVLRSNNLRETGNEENQLTFRISKK